MKRSIRCAALIVAIGILPGIALAASYGPDQTTTGNAISNGDASGGAKGNGFDNDLATFWETSTIAANCVSSGAWLGQDFGLGVTKDVRRLWLYTAATSRGITSVVVQTSDDGSSWTSAETIAIVNDALNHSYDLAEHGGHRWWRVLCNSVPSGAWRINEFEMDEILNDTPTPTSIPATATITPTPSTTPSPTADIFQFITSTGGPAMRIERSSSYGERYIFYALIAIAFILIVWIALWFWRGQRNA